VLTRSQYGNNGDGRSHLGQFVRQQKGCMATTHIAILDRKAFLKKIGTRKTARKYEQNQAIFGQGDAADSLFYIESGNVKLTVLSNRGKRQSLPFCGKAISSARAVLHGEPFDFPPRRRFNNPRYCE